MKPPHSSVDQNFNPQAVQESNPVSKREMVEDIFEQVNEKVQVVLRIHELVVNDEHLDTITSDDLRKELEGIYDEHILSDDVNMEATKLYVQIHKILDEIAVLKANRKSKKQEGVLTETERVEIRDKIDQLKSEIVLLGKEGGQHLEYISRIKNYINYLVQSKKKRDELKAIYDSDENHQAFKDYIQEYFTNYYKKYREDMLKKHGGNFKGRNLGNSAYYGKYVKEVSFRGLAAMIMFDNKVQNLRAFNYVLGQASFGRGFCLYFEKAKDHTPDHEYNHVLYGALPEHLTVYHGRFVDKIRHTIQSSKIGVLEDIPEIIIATDVENYYLKLRGEIFADLTRIFDHHLISGFYTHYRKTCSSLESYMDSLGSENKYYNILKESIEKLDKKVDTMIDQYQELVFYSEHLNIKEEVKSMLIVFGANPRKVLRHVKHMYIDKIHIIPPYDKDDDKNILSRYHPINL